MQEERANTVQGPDLSAKDKYLFKLLPVIKSRGLSHLRIDDIARHMDISKATFYKHFTSKEEVIELMVKIITNYLVQEDPLINDETASYIQRFQKAFEQSVLIASYLSDAFLLDLKQSFPGLWQQVKQAQREHEQHMQHFYERGIAAGVFQPLHPVLVMLQDELILRAIMDPVFLMEHDLTLRAILLRYYELQKYQWLTPDVRSQVDDEPIKSCIDMMARKISLSLY